jgi:hypothetical protein
MMTPMAIRMAPTPKAQISSRPNRPSVCSVKMMTKGASAVKIAGPISRRTRPTRCTTATMTPAIKKTIPAVATTPSVSSLPASRPAGAAKKAAVMASQPPK